MIDKKILEEHNLTEEEFKSIVSLIGREPNITELGIFSLMWSEHCSYKSSKVHISSNHIKANFAQPSLQIELKDSIHHVNIEYNLIVCTEAILKEFSLFEGIRED